MSRAPVKKLVNGHEYEIVPWDGMFALTMTQRLAAAIKESGASERVSGVFSALAGDGDAMEQDVPVAAIADAVVSVLSYGNTPSLVRDMLYGTTRNGKDISMDSVFNEAYAGNIGELVKVIPGIVEANFGDFFGMAGAIGAAPANGNSKGESPAN